MHPLTTFDVHRQEQGDLLRRSTWLPVREPVDRPRAHAHGRPPDPAHTHPGVGADPGTVGVGAPRPVAP